MIKEIIKSSICNEYRFKYSPSESLIAICICDFCGEEFTRRYSNVKDYKKNYCSTKCQHASQDKRVEIKCKYCGEITKKHIWDIENPFCNGDCHKKYWSANSIKALLKCSYCGNLFKRYKSAHPETKHYFCSKKCYLDYCSRGTVEKICDYCGEKIIREAASLNAKHFFCDHVCFYKYNKGINHTNFKNGFKTKNGYKYIKVDNHPNATKAGYVLEHHIVIEESIGRYLYPYETVHHINGIPDDNRIENLQHLPSQGEHNTKVQKVYQENLRLIKELEELKLQLVN